MDVYVSITSCTGHNSNNSTTPSFSISTTTSNSNHFHQSLLECLNKEKATLYLPVIIFLIVLIVTGTFGNLLVCCVYWGKSYKASSHYFILSLAILDLFSCLIGLPTEIADLSFPYIFNMPVACKVLRFTHSSTIIASSTILIQVAFDRYFRICKLGQQFSVRKAKLLCVMAILLGVMTSWPSCLLFGRKTLNLHVPITRRVLKVSSSAQQGQGQGQGLETRYDFTHAEHVRYEVLPAADCSTDDSVRGTIYPTIYYLFLFTLFFLTITFFAVLYSRIGVAIWRRKRKTIGSKVVTKMNSHGSDQTSTELSSEVDAAADNHHHSRSNNNNSLTTGTLPRGSGRKKGTEETIPHIKRRQIRVGKTTTVLFAVTLAYILSFLPYLVVMILRSTIKDFEGRLSPVGEVAYKFCVKSFFINNAINPLIYSFLNAGFRKDARHALRKMFHNCLCRCFCCGHCCCGDREDDLSFAHSPGAV